jgi:RNA polymerase sigma-70 factor (ECF subfamily)
MTAVVSALDDQAALVRLAASGDAQAFERLVGLHHEDLRRICALVVGEAVADDAVQTAWTIAWRKLDTVRDPSRVRAWLASVAINEARRLLRGRTNTTVLEIGPIDAHGDPAGGIPAIDLRNSLARLSPDERALIGMRYVAGFDSNELAAATGMSASGVRSKLARLMERLEKELGDE